MTPSDRAPSIAAPTHGCARCGRPVAVSVGLCEECNPLGLRDVAASQVHGTVLVMILVGFVALAIAASLAVRGLGPFPATIDDVVPAAGGLAVTLTVTNEGSASGATTCRVSDAADRGGGRSAFVLSPELGPSETATFSQVVTTFGERPIELVVECRTP